MHIFKNMSYMLIYVATVYDIKGLFQSHNINVFLHKKCSDAHVLQKTSEHWRWKTIHDVKLNKKMWLLTTFSLNDINTKISQATAVIPRKHDILNFLFYSQVHPLSQRLTALLWCVWSSDNWLWCFMLVSGWKKTKPVSILFPGR